MPESLTLQRLRQLLRDIETGKLTDRAKAGVWITDTDGRNVRLTDPDVRQVLERLIAAEGG